MTNIETLENIWDTRWRQMAFNLFRGSRIIGATETERGWCVSTERIRDRWEGKRPHMNGEV